MGSVISASTYIARKDKEKQTRADPLKQFEKYKRFLTQKDVGTLVVDISKPSESMILHHIDSVDKIYFTPHCGSLEIFEYDNGNRYCSIFDMSINDRHFWNSLRKDL